jgi:hypothetical protein
MPSDRGLWLHDEQRHAPVPPKAGKANPKQSVCGVKTKPTALRPYQDCELVTESENLDLKRRPSPKPRSQAGKRGTKEGGKHRAARYQGRLLRSMIAVETTYLVGTLV